MKDMLHISLFIYAIFFVMSIYYKLHFTTLIIISCVFIIDRYVKNEEFRDMANRLF